MHAVARISTDDFFVSDDIDGELDFDAVRDVLEGEDAPAISVRGHKEHRRGGNLRERIEVTPDEHVVIEKTLDALAGDDAIYHRDGRLVHVIFQPTDDVDDGIERSAGTPRIASISSAYLRERLAARCYFYKMQANGEARTEVQVSPPSWAIESIHTRGFWKPLRRLAGITETPVLRADGSILDEPGWDSQTELLFAPSGAIPEVPDNPTLDDAMAAADELFDVVSDFPFAKREHRSAWMAGFLTPLARRAFNGPVPLTLIDANTRGSGKSMLTDVIGIVINGRPMPRLSNPGDDDEARKRITSIVLAGDALTLIDNINGPLGSASLDAALTSTSWKDRRLGASEMVEAPLRTCFYGTGNNIVLQADTSRRVVHCRLESPEENPEEREGFKYPHLMEHVRRNRLRLLTAGLTILRAFYVAGRPDAGLKPWGSFEGWSGLVRNCLAWIGQPDPGETRRELAEQSDRDAAALRVLFAGWSEVDPSGDGLTAAELVRMLDGNEARFEGVRSALVELCGAPGGKALNARLIGNQLRRFRGRVMGGQRLEMKTGRARTNRWTVTGGVSGASGESLSHPLTREAQESIKEKGGSTDSPQSPHTPTGECGNCGAPVFGADLLCRGCGPEDFQ